MGERKLESEQSKGMVEVVAGLVRDDPRNKALALDHTGIKKRLFEPMNNRNSQLRGSRDYITQAEMRAEMALLWKDPNDYSLEEIAERVSDMYGLEGNERLTKRSVNSNISRLFEYWKQVQMMAVDDKMSMVQARYGQLEAIAEMCLFRSMEGKEVNYHKKQIEKAHKDLRKKWIAEEIQHQREEMKKDGKGLDLNKIVDHLEDSGLTVMNEKIEEYQRTETEVGDPRWLNALITINDKRADLWNLKNHAEVMTKDQEVAAMSDEARDKRLTALLQAASDRKANQEGLSTSSLATPQPLGGHKPLTPEETIDFSPEDLAGIEF